ncbi:MULTISPECIES: tetratricopeptide repeat protein [Pseudonocardia]|uniref:Tetratricopeptide repeat protein n=1 Tax=Pseudonocardia alni subsp. carboxydivorans TaxID=415010 RepID=A0ABU9AIC6_PSEA5|nr:MULTISPECIES: tetratricopeptide repeat protein [Pseudonocardia]MCM3849981.1 tetratricopeptide repeat protein [Pseudonocardia sp. DR1-2]
MRIDALSWMTGTEAGPADRWEHAGYLFDSGDPAGAATVLAELVAEQPEAAAVRLLLARAYYHSAQLGRAETELRELVRREPADGYAHLLLGRTLQRRSRHDEAAPHLRLAEAMGVSAG